MRSTPLEIAGIQHILELLIKFILDIKSWKEQMQCMWVKIKRFVQHTLSYSHTAAPTGRKRLSRFTPMDTVGIQHILKLLKKFILEIKNWKEQMQCMWAQLKRFVQHTLSYSHTAAPIGRKRLSRCTPFKIVGIQHILKLLIIFIYSSKRMQEQKQIMQATTGIFIQHTEPITHCCN